MSFICPKCGREIKSINQWHNCVTVSIESLFEGKAAELSFAFDKLLSEMADWTDVIVSTTQHCIVFVHHQTFAVIKPMKKQLDIKFYSETKQEEEFIQKSTFYSGKYENHIRISSSDELTGKLFSLLKISYRFL